MLILKQSTQIKVRVGPFLDVADGFTPETGITLGAADEAELLKANGVATVDISGATWAAVTGCRGWYDLTLTTSHTDTVGELVIVVQDDSVCLPVCVRAYVVEEEIYDKLFASSAAGLLGVNAIQISGSVTAADKLELSALQIVSGTAQGTPTATLIDTDLTEATNDHYNGRILIFTSGANINQARTITDYNGTTKELTTDAFTEAPAAGDAFIIV